MHNRRSKRPPRVEIHPASIKYLKQGHPWITEDSFTRQFPKTNFLVGVDRGGREVAFLLQDKEHQKIKARLWSLEQPFPNNDVEFNQQLFERLQLSFEKRLNSNIPEQRENYYLVFGEADYLPGLQILAIKDRLFFIYYAYFWKEYEDKLLKYAQKLLPDKFIQIISQQRNTDKKSKRKVLYTSEKAGDRLSSKLVCKEFGIDYEINTNDFYDMGIYTDMSSIRYQLEKYLKESKSVLNLYSYTGAFSLFALEHGAESVYSVDLSSKYLDWLDRNLQLNPQLDLSKHHRMDSSVDKALDQLISENITFDCIICDPPTFSSDGKNASKAIDSYEELIPKFDKLLNKNGVAAIFLNTHAINRNQFTKKIENILHNCKLTKKWKTEKAFRLSGDVLTKKGFPEGDYLKGILFRKA